MQNKTLALLTLLCSQWSLQAILSRIIFTISWLDMGHPRWCSGKEYICQWRHKSSGFNPWVGEIPWSMKRQPAPVFLTLVIILSTHFSEKELACDSRRTFCELPALVLDHRWRSFQVQFSSWKGFSTSWFQDCWLSCDVSSLMNLKKHNFLVLPDFLHY